MKGTVTNDRGSHHPERSIAFRARRGITTTGVPVAPYDYEYPLDTPVARIAAECFLCKGRSDLELVSDTVFVCRGPHEWSVW